MEQQTKQNLIELHTQLNKETERLNLTSQNLMNNIITKINELNELKMQLEQIQEPL